MPKVNLEWSDHAKLDLREIQAYHGRNAPKAAAAFVKKLRAAVGLLRRHPEMGAIVPEWQDPRYREIQYGNYRIIYKYVEPVVSIVTVWRASRPLRTEFLE